MRFPNALFGVKKLYAAEILAVIAAVALLIIVLLGAGILGEDVDTDLESVDAATAVTAASVALLALIASIVAIVSLVLMIVGLNRAKLDEPAFRTAFILAIISLCVSLVVSINNNVNTDSLIGEKISTYISVAVDALSLAATVFVIKGIMNLAVQLVREDMVEKGNMVLKLVIGAQAIAIVTALASGIIGEDGANNLPFILSVVSMAAGIAASCIYIYYLAKAKKMLEE